MDLEQLLLAQRLQIGQAAAELRQHLDVALGPDGAPSLTAAAARGCCTQRHPPPPLLKFAAGAVMHPPQPSVGADGH